MAEYKGVLTFGEVAEGKLTSITTELLGCGRKLAADLNEELGAILVGSGVSKFAPDAITFGADKVYIVDDPVFKDYQTDSYVIALEKVVGQVNPRILILGQTSIGRDLAPRLAFRLKTGLTMDCIDLDIVPETRLLQQYKPVYGGNAHGIFTSELAFPQMATVRLKAMEALAPDASRKGKVIPVKVQIDPNKIRIKVLDRVRKEVTGVKLEDAQVVVCGGRGIGDPEGFNQLEELAKVLKGVIGATRPPCDNGWVPTTIQIGLTGKIVTPDVYIGIGVSGSSQHFAGCSGSKNIIAINRDPEANIFKEAHFGAVGDWKQLMPAFIAKIKELLTA